MGLAAHVVANEYTEKELEALELLKDNSLFMDYSDLDLTQSFDDILTSTNFDIVILKKILKRLREARNNY